MEYPLFRWEDIDRQPGEEAFMRRMTLLKLPGRRRLYLHRFLGTDPCKDPHDHPKRFISIGLWGSYDEIVYTAHRGLFGKTELRSTVKTWTAPWIRQFEPERIHRIEKTNSKSAWTLVFTGPATREWGFWHLGLCVWFPFERYLERFSATRRDTDG